MEISRGLPRPLVDAHDWVTAGVKACLRGGEPEDPDELRRLLRLLRYRIRNDLGLPEDNYDMMLD